MFARIFCFSLHYAFIPFQRTPLRRWMQFKADILQSFFYRYSVVSLSHSLFCGGVVLSLLTQARLTKKLSVLLAGKTSSPMHVWIFFIASFSIRLYTIVHELSFIHLIYLLRGRAIASEQTLTILHCRLSDICIEIFVYLIRPKAPKSRVAKNWPQWAHNSQSSN